MNVVVLRGTLSRPSERRLLPSGSTVVAYEVTTRDADGRAATVPVAWADPAGACDFDAGQEVVVAGRVQRRYFRAGGSTQSRTEVVADAVVPGSAKRRASALLARTRAAIEP
jgi:single-strand DNA-binding protein